MEEQTITIAKGEVVLRKPTAGVRNRALIKAEEVSKSDTPSRTAFIIEMLPHCIKSHPFGTIPVSQALDSLDIEEYDKLSKALGELLKPSENIIKN